MGAKPLPSSIGSERPSWFDGGDLLGRARSSSGFVETARQVLARLLLVFGMLLGGGGQPIIYLGLELVSVLLIVLIVAQPITRGKSAKFANAVVLITCAVPLVQLLPLPLDFWRSLPGRDLPFQVQAAADALGGYHALSLDPDATRRAALFLLPGIAIFLATLRADWEERRLLALVAAIVVVTSALLGVVQVATGQFYPYATAHVGTSVGVFTNRNHQADLVMVGMLLIAPLIRGRAPTRGLLPWFALLLMLGLCVVTTTSRMGNALMPFALLASFAIIIGRQGVWASWQLGFAAALAVIVLLVVSGNPVLTAVLERFGDSTDDQRFGFWTDGMVALRTYWPAGSGLGTFVPVFAQVENLNSVTDRYVNHAHNDYLELLIEGGILAVVALTAYFSLIATQAVRAVLANEWPMRCAAVAAVFVILIHSFVDYPLRTMTLSILFGLVNALLFGARGDMDDAKGGKRLLAGSGGVVIDAERTPPASAPAKPAVK
jgi:O-antigen ligase